MFKRSFLTCFFIFCLIFSLSFACFASNSISFNDYRSEMNWYYAPVSIPEPGNYTYSLTITSPDGVSKYKGTCSFVTYSNDDYSYSLTTISAGNYVMYISDEGESDSSYLSFEYSIPDDPRDTSFVFTFNKIINSDFTDSTTTGLNTVINWIGNTVDSFLNGSLSPLLIIFAISIAVSLLLFGVKFIFNLIWGV